MVSRLGGNEDFSAQAYPSTVIYLQIHVLASPQESVTFIVDPLHKLERILMTLCTQQYWLTNDVRTRKPRFSSMSRGSHSLKANPKFHDRTKDFHRELTKLLGIIGITPEHPSPASHSPTPTSASSSPGSDDPLSTFDSINDAGSSSVSSATSAGSSPPSIPSASLIYEQFGRRVDPPAAPTSNTASAAILKTLSFAKKMVRGAYDPSYSRAFVPLSDHMDNPIYKIFSRREVRECSEQNPIHLYLYLSAGYDLPATAFPHAPASPVPSPTLGRRGSKLSISSHRPSSGVMSPIGRDQPIALTQDMVSMLTGQLGLLTTKESTEELEEYKKTVNDLHNVAAVFLKEMLPSPEDPDSETSASTVPSASRARTGLFPFFNKSDKSNPMRVVSGTPLHIVCSHALHVFPWELMLHADTIVRHMSFWDVATPRPPTHASTATAPFPRFVTVYHSQGEKAVAQLDASRRDTLAKRMRHSLRITPEPPSSHRAACTPLPFHTPLVKLGKKSNSYKRKYKYFVDFIDLSDPMTNISKFVQAVDANSYPVFILTFADLLDASQTVLYMIRTMKCTALFVPGGRLKSVMTKLVKQQELNSKHSATKGGSGGIPSQFQYLMSLLSYIQEDQVTPIAVFNPPAL